MPRFIKKKNTKQPREFRIDSDVRHKNFRSNRIRTSKYTAWNFLPKAILLQFRRPVNIYFLLAAVLQSINEISSLSPVSAIAPFIIVIALSVLREGVEDIPRQKSDKKINKQEVPVLNRHGTFSHVKWKQLEVSKITLVREGEDFPADLVLLKSSNDNGMAFLETSNLDGEKNLKPKFSVPEIAAYFDDKAVKNQEIYRCSIFAQPPDSSIYRFEGAFINEEGFKTILSAKQILLRGSRLKNTDWVLGAVVYSGHDTKVMKNAELSKTKQSRIEKKMNKYILYILLVQLVLCAITAIANRIWDSIYLDDSWYLDQTINPNLEAFYMFLAYFLLTNTMIPISLVVTMEIVKFIQARFIEFDEDMYSVKKEKGCRVFCSTINEELGLVDYIFSDKTGTLTSNEMVFKNFVIGNEVYGVKEKPKIYADKHYEQRSRSLRENYAENNDDVSSSMDEQNFEDSKLKNVLSSDESEPINLRILDKNGQEAMKLETHRDLVMEFMQSIATCHECLAERDKEGNIIYQGQSQDEIRLVETAASNGFKLTGGSLEKMQVSILGTEKEFQILQIFDFTSDRKRMSMILRDGMTIKLYMKGADNMVMERLRKDVEQPFVNTVNKKLEDFSRKGYRTLVFAMRVIDEDEYMRMRERIDDIATDVDREEKIHAIAEEYERDLYLTGCSAVEDKLQDHVPKVIHDFLRAKIKVWMLTGDKLETAENIAHSCKLITGDMHVMRCYGKTLEAVQDKLMENKDNFDLCRQERKPKAFIIEGEALTFILANPAMETLLISMVLECEAVVCCRAAPKQKAEMVRLVKERTGKVTLAIGDGANDVNMIQAANIGVGLYGHEGVQAVQASDFAIPEFQALWRLIIIHGRWSYLRISEMILYFFYKNMIFTLPQFYFAFVNGFSAQTLYDNYYVAMYNLLFTGFALGAKACWEKDVDYKIRLPRKQVTPQQLYVEDPDLKKVMPKLYAENKMHPIFTNKAFFFAILEGFIMAVALFLYGIFAVNHRFVNDDGIPHELWSMSITIYTAIIWMVSIKLCVYTRYWNSMFVSSLVILTFAVFYAFTFVYNVFTQENSSWTVGMVYESFVSWAFVIYFAGIQLLLDLSMVAYQKAYKPTPADLLRKKAKKQKGIVPAPHVLPAETRQDGEFEMLQIGGEELGGRQGPKTEQDSGNSQERKSRESDPTQSGLVIND